MEQFAYTRRGDVDASELIRRLAERRRSVTVVVTVYNGGSVVRDCLSSVVRHSPAGTRILVLDDASDDPETVALLTEFQREGAVEIVRHPVNLGYTRNVNHGLAMAPLNDVVLLNSDTRVGPQWLSRLQWVAYAKPGVGTVSAVSNDAAANSVPRRHQGNSWYPRLEWDSVARLVARRCTLWSQEVPSAHGFCVYLRRDLLDAIGAFDAELFPIGYGEEVDLSIRAKAAGWLNLVAPHVIVYHARSSSFGLQRRAELVEASKEHLKQRYPTFRHEVALWESSIGTALVEATTARLRTGWWGGDVGRRVARRLGPTQHPRWEVLRDGPGSDGEPVGQWSDTAMNAVTSSPREDVCVARLAIDHAVEVLAGVVQGDAGAREVRHTAELLGLIVE